LCQCTPSAERARHSRSSIEPNLGWYPIVNPVRVELKINIAYGLSVSGF
jgi:hypothetical protein